MQDLVENPQVVPIQSIPTIEQKTTAVPISIPISADVINQALEAFTKYRYKLYCQRIFHVNWLNLVALTSPE